MKKIFKFIVFLVPWFISSLLFKSDTIFYKSLNKPVFAPPGIVFPIVWTILYILIAISIYLIFKDNKLSHLIEYQGAQHYQCPDYWNDVSEHDKRKKEYCIQKNIPLIEIPYWDFNKINIELLMTY